MKIVLGLGTNIGTREQNLKDALAAIALLPNTVLIKQSPVYETKPYGYADQSDFLNMAVEVETDLPPESIRGAHHPGGEDRKSGISTTKIKQDLGLKGSKEDE